MLKTLASPILALLSLLYVAAIWVRHRLFDLGVLRSRRFATPVICIGNITVGGSGKTPLIEMMINRLNSDKNIAILSRGYGRTTKGFREVCEGDSYLDVGDEPLQIKRKFPKCRVVVCESRAEAIPIIERMTPKVDVILMDDGFQHRYVTPTFNIVVIDSTRPFWRDYPLPYGSLRDLRSSLRRADLFVVSKCRSDISSATMDSIRKHLHRYGDQNILFTRIINDTPLPLFGAQPPIDPSTQSVVALSGIGNPRPFVATLREQFKVVKELNYGDHHSYRAKDIASMEQLLSADDSVVIVTTEKDGIKFPSVESLPERLRTRLYYLPMKIEIIR